MLEQMIAIWAPSLAAIIGVVCTVVIAAAKVKDAFEVFKKDETLKGIESKLISLSNENKELTRCNKLLLDELTKIKGYADNMKEK